MMDSKHLRQLLNEDQEPFVLKNYIDERRFQLKRQESKTHLQAKTRKPITQNPIFQRNFCKNVCLFSFHDSPDVKKSPLFDFTAPTKKPITDSNTLFVHIPSRTATLLLEAALRIQKESSAKKPKTPKNLNFGFLGSILKRITHRKRNPKREFEGDQVRVSVKDILSWDSSEDHTNVAEERADDNENKINDMGFSCSCTRILNNDWCEINEEKSLDLETSTSTMENSDKTEFVYKERKIADFGSCDHGFDSNPFRVVPQNRSPSGHSSPEFEIPATSPSRRKKQAVKNDEGHLNCVGNDYQDEEKEQSSPVSVLDPQFDEEEGQENEQTQEEKDGFELERSFAIVQRTKQQLLHKLRRFERLAELDPIELEKRITEEEDEDQDEEEEESDYSSDDDDSILTDNNKNEAFIREVLSQSKFFNSGKVPSHMERLILDLVAEVKMEEIDYVDKELLVNKLCTRLDTSKELERNTIDMMVGLDFKREEEKWLKTNEHVQDMAVAIELAIFSFLVEEISIELVPSIGLSI